MAAGERLDVGLPLFTLGTAHQVPRTNSGATAPEWVGLSSLLDSVFGSTVGSLLVRSDTTWTALDGSIATGNVLAGQGASNPPAMTAASSVLDSAFGSTQGMILYRDSGGNGWAALAVGTAGQVLQTGGASANPSWVTPGGSTLDTQNQSSGTSLTFSVPADTISAAGDALLVFIAGTTDAGSAETMRLRYGGTTMLGNAVNAGRQWFGCALIVSTGTNSQVSAGFHAQSDGAEFARADSRNTGAVDAGDAQDLILDYSTSGSASRIITLMHVVRLA